MHSFAAATFDSQAATSAEFLQLLEASVRASMGKPYIEDLEALHATTAEAFSADIEPLARIVRDCAGCDLIKTSQEKRTSVEISPSA